MRLAIAVPAGVVRRLCAIVFLDSLGSGFFLAGSAVFFTRGAGLSASQVGFGLSCAGLVGLPASAVMGALSDRYGARHMCVITTAAEGLLFAVYPFVRSFPAFLATVCLVGAAHFGTIPSWGAIVAGVVPDAERVRTRAYLHSVANAAIAVGSLLAVIPLAAGTRVAFDSLAFVNAISFLVAAWLVRGLPPVPRCRHHEGEHLFVALREPRVLAVVGLSAVLSLHTSLLLVAMPLWIVQRTAMPGSLVAVLLALNTILVVTLQVRASQGTDTWRGAAGTARRSGFWLAPACGLLGLSAHGPAGLVLALLVIATILLTGAELMQRAGNWGLSYSLAPPDRQGEYQGAFGLSRAAQTVVGPFITTTLVVGFGPTGWIALAGAVLAAGWLIVPAAAAAASRPVPTAESRSVPATLDPTTAATT